MGHRPENLPPSLRDSRPSIYAAPYESSSLSHNSSLDGFVNDFAELRVQSVDERRRSLPVCSMRIYLAQCTQFRGCCSFRDPREAIWYDRPHLSVSPIHMQMGSSRLSISLLIQMAEEATNMTTARDSPSSIIRIQHHYQTPTNRRMSRLPHRPVTNHHSHIPDGRGLACPQRHRALFRCQHPRRQASCPSHLVSRSK